MAIIIDIRSVDHFQDTLGVYIEIVSTIFEGASGKRLESAMYPRRFFNMAHDFSFQIKKKKDFLIFYLTRGHLACFSIHTFLTA